MSQEPPPRTVRDLLSRGRGFLERKGVAHGRLEAELLVAHALRTDRLHVFLEIDRPVDAGEIDRARELLVRRGKGEPSAYLTGTREFYGRSFGVRPGVLIPRPETELLVDRARLHLARSQARAEAGEPRDVLDVGTGSGCLAITIALECSPVRVTASDVSAAALAVARENADRLGADVELVEGDGLAPFAGRSFDVVVSNPPYVVRGDAGLEPGVLAFEPAEALFAPGGDPDHWAHRLAEATGLLRPGGLLLVELGHDQAARLGPWLAERGRAWRLHRDLAGVERVLELAPPGERLVEEGGS